MTEAHEGIVSVDVAEELAVGGGRPRGRAIHGLDEVGEPEPAGAVRYLGGVRLVRVVHRDVEIRIQQTRRDGEADDARADDRGAWGRSPDADATIDGSRRACAEPCARNAARPTDGAHAAGMVDVASALFVEACERSFSRETTTGRSGRCDRRVASRG